MSEQTLENIRLKIDDIDNRLHDLLMERANYLGEIIELKKKDAPSKTKEFFYRPSREAEVLKRLLARHKGDLSHTTIIALWRTLLSSFCSMQGDFSVAYCSLTEPDALRDLVRYYFSSVVKLKKSGTELSVLHAVSSNDVTLGVVPIYSEDDIDEWWLNLPSGIYASGMLPFVRNDHVSHVQQDYVILSPCLATPTDKDKTLLKVIAKQDVGRASVISLFAKAGYTAKGHAIVNPKDDITERYHLIEVDGYIEPSTMNDLIINMKKISGQKILDMSYLGSFPAPIDMHDFSEHEVF